MNLHRVRLILAAVVLGVGGLAALAGDPRPPLAADEISAVQLAELIRARAPGLLLLDARDSATMQRDHLPGARSAAGLDPAMADAADTLVVYADHTIDDATIAALRARLPPRPLLRLRGGVAAWNADVLFPVLRTDAPDRQRRMFESRAALSRYFGGSPRTVDPGASPPRTRSRRGC